MSVPSLGPEGRQIYEGYEVLSPQKKNVGNGQGFTAFLLPRAGQRSVKRCDRRPEHRPATTARKRLMNLTFMADGHFAHVRGHWAKLNCGLTWIRLCRLRAAARC